MPLKVLMILLFLPLAIDAFATASRESAYRSLNVDYTKYESRALRNNIELSSLRKSALRSARKYNELELPEVTPWSSLSVMQKRFEAIRDRRFLILNSDPDFPRRISWLYPKDGCYARAAMFNRNAFQMFIPIPKKVFVFGNLRVKTPNARRGVVGWWYHVAPIVEVQGQKYVLDPSINHEAPMTLKDWLSSMGKPERMKVAICNSGTYSPGDDCQKITDGLELRAETTQKHYLDLEARELRRMGRDPESELGDEPPWE